MIRRLGRDPCRGNSTPDEPLSKSGTQRDQTGRTREGPSLSSPTSFVDQSNLALTMVPVIRRPAASIRPRTLQLSQANAQRSDQFSVSFNSKSADVVIRTCDGYRFALERDVLAHHSLVLRDKINKAMWRDPTPCRGSRHKDQKAPRLLLQVQVEETGTDLEVYLRWIHEHTHRQIFAEFVNEWSILSTEPSSLVALLDCAQKYKTKSITTTVSRFLIQLAEHQPENTLALGIIYNQKRLLTAATLAWLNRVVGQTWRDGEMIHHVLLDNKGHHIYRCYRAQSVSTIWTRLATQLPPKFLQYIELTQLRIRDKELCDTHEAAEALSRAICVQVRCCE